MSMGYGYAVLVLLVTGYLLVSQVNSRMGLLEGCLNQWHYLQATTRRPSMAADLMYFFFTFIKVSHSCF
jgi:hypothetical protein